MEILETQDPEKRKLIETSDRHKRELEKDLTEVSDRTNQVLKNALIIGGTLALSYLIISQFSSSSKKKKAKIKVRAVTPSALAEEESDDVAAGLENNILTQVGTKIVNTATLVLLDLAKEKLAEFLQSQKASKDENS